MKKKINLKKLFIILLIIVPIGFAVLTSNLNIKGSFSFLENSFNVYLDKVKITTSTAENTTTNLDSNKSSISITGNFKKPGDYIEFSFYAINGGTIDAVIDQLEITGIDSSVQAYFTNTIKYVDTADVKKNDFLQAGTARKIIVQIKYKYEVDEFIPVENLNVSINLKYIQSPSSNNTSWNYEFIDQEQYFIVPKSGTYKIELWGAQGDGMGQKVGLGGYTSGVISLDKNKKFFIYVGEEGKRRSYDERLFNGKNFFNGGGYCYLPLSKGFASNGGGATDIRLNGGEWDNFASLKTRVMVAAGGGAYGYLPKDSPGSGGGLNGYDSIVTSEWQKYPKGMGATQTGAGEWNIENTDKDILIKGGFGFAGNSIGSWDGGGSGGSGYYGGSGGKVNPGGGGSSFISGHDGCDAISEASTEDNIVHTGQSIHYSGMKFINTIMIDGKGYQWTTEKGEEVVGMPSHDGKTTMIGNNGNGYAKITLVEEDGKYLCKRATALHTRVCRNNLDNSKMCTKLGYSIGDTITYGNLVNSKDYKPGDAFDCDVNGDGKYDSENERFYYVTDLESNPKYGVLVYSSSVKNGVKKNTATEEHIHYDSSGVNNNGPVTAISDLPTKSQWPNVELFNNRRQIISSEGETTTLDGSLPVFEYTNKTSRLITLQEAKKGCFNNSSVDKKCEYLVEDTSFENPNFYINNWGLLTETPSGTQSHVVCRIDSHSLDIRCIYKSNLDYFLIKPVIEVHKNKIQ